jgi:hypothetical protein
MLAYMRRGAYAIDVYELERRAVKEAFDETREHVEETGLSGKAIEDKRTVVARRELVRLFMASALNDTTSKEQRAVVESIAVEALARGDGCTDYLSQFCAPLRATGL